MKLKRRFFNSEIDFRSISKQRIVLGIFIGLVSAFSIYGILYLSREVYRLMVFDYDTLPNILSEFERNTYNWLFSGLSVILGNSIAVCFILTGAHKAFEIRNPYRRRIVNDQIGLNSYFMFWFAKICFVLSFFSMGFVDFNFLPEYLIPIVLVLLVLYLETWKNLRLVFRKAKFIIIHFIILFVLSFLMSKVEFVDYKSIDETNLKYKPIVELPKAVFNNASYFDYSLGVYIKPDNNEKVLFHHYENDIDASYLDFIDFKMNMYEGIYDKISIRILAHENSDLKAIKKLEKQIKKAKINYVIYGAFEDDIAGKRFSRKGLKIKLKDSFLYEDNRLKDIRIGRPILLDVEKKLNLLDTVNVVIGNEIKINKKIIKKEDLTKEFLSLINSTTIFKYNYSSNSNYQKYITVLSSHLNAIKKIREKNSKVLLIWDKKKFKYINKEQFIKHYQRLCDAFPFRVIEKLSK